MNRPVRLPAAEAAPPPVTHPVTAASQPGGGDRRMIPPPAQRAMAERIGARTVDVPGTHSVHNSWPDAAADLIKQAVRG